MWLELACKPMDGAGVGVGAGGVVTQVYKYMDTYVYTHTELATDMQPPQLCVSYITCRKQDEQ